MATRLNNFSIALVLLLLASGCSSPLTTGGPSDIQRMVLASAQSQVDRTGADRPGQLVSDADTDSSYPAEVRRELDALSSPQRNGVDGLDAGEALDHSDDRPIRLSLAQSLITAATNNLDIRLAKVIPQIRQTQVVEAEAEFDITAFGEVNAGHTDLPIPASTLNGVPVGSDATIRDTGRLEAGLRKRLQETGGTISVSTGTDYINDQSPRLNYDPDPGWTANVALAFSQPLLRDFGPQVNGARIELAANARDRDVLAVRQAMLQTAGDTEAAYWELVLAHHRLAIQDELLTITKTTRDEVQQREDVDANPVQLAQAESEVRSRQAEVIRTQAALRQASDRLKRVLNDPELPLAGEAVIRPTDFPEELPEYHSLRAAIGEAIRSRPDLGQILLEVDDNQIRRRVAANQKLPRLDLTGEVRHYGLGNDFDGGYGSFGDDYLEYLVGLQFEMPLGNRAAEAAHRRTRLSEQAQVIRYRNAAQDVILSVKEAMRSMRSSYRVFELSRAGRRAAAENLRALLEREKTGQDLTPEFLLDLKLRTQQRLAQAQTEEIQSIIEYNIARARFYQSVGRLLDQHDIHVDVPSDIPERQQVK